MRPLIPRKKILLHITLYFLLALAFSRVVSPKIFYISEGDDQTYYAHARTWLLDRDLNYANEPLESYKRDAGGHQQKAARYSLGPAIAVVPALALGSAFAAVTGRYSSTQIAEGITVTQMAFACISSILLAFTGALFLFRFLCDQLKVNEPKLEWWLPILASPLLYYLVRRPLMSHAAEFFSLCSALYLTSKLDFGIRQLFHADRPNKRLHRVHFSVKMEQCSLCCRILSSCLLEFRIFRDLVYQ